MKVAVCQVSARVGEKARNRALWRSAVINAADAGAQIVVLPELVNTGYSFRDFEELWMNAEAPDGPTVTEWVDLARERDIVIVGGFPERGADGKAYNSAALVDPRGIRAVYRKVHLWNGEKNYFTPGDEAPAVVDTVHGRLALMICYDVEFPEWARMVGLAGAELLCCPVNWPLVPRPDGERPGEIVKVQAQASSNRMFIAVADRAETDRAGEWIGGSVIVDPDGYPLTTIEYGRDDMHIAELDLQVARIKQIAEQNDVFLDRRPELYGPVIEPLRSA